MLSDANGAIVSASFPQSSWVGASLRRADIVAASRMRLRTPCTGREKETTSKNNNVRDEPFKSYYRFVMAFITPAIVGRAASMSKKTGE
jgi:hypothetical protein